MTDREKNLDDEFTDALGRVCRAVKELSMCNRTMARLYPYARQACGILEEVATELGAERKAGSEARIASRQSGRR